MKTALALGLVVALTGVATTALSAAAPSRSVCCDEGLGASGQTVEMMVVGRTRTLLSARDAVLAGGAIAVGKRRCAVPAGTALAGLVFERLPIHVTDAAGCDPTALFVTRVGHDPNAGQAGWQYKVGHASPSFGAGDPGGRLRSGEQLLWLWCVRASACQRTLAVVPGARRIGPGASLGVRVLGYDDNGHAQAVGGATVHLGPVTTVTAANGSVAVAAPTTPGHYELFAHKPGLVRSFPVEVVVT
jgi:hypothetical protein